MVIPKDATLFETKNERLMLVDINAKSYSVMASKNLYIWERRLFRGRTVILLQYPWPTVLVSVLRTELLETGERKLAGLK